MRVKSRMSSTITVLKKKTELTHILITILRGNILPPPVALQPNTGHGLLILEVSRSHTTTQHIWQDSSGQVISSSQRPLPDNTQHSQQTNIHAPGGIRTHDLSRQAAADLCLRPRGHWDRHIQNMHD